MCISFTTGKEYINLFVGIGTSTSSQCLLASSCVLIGRDFAKS